MKPTAKRRFGRVDLTVTAMGFGAGPIGNQGRPVAEEEAAALVKAAWDAGLRYFDTSPMYGHGLSEARIGAALRWYRRDDYVLCTKVGRLLKARPRREIDFAPWVDGLPFEMRFDYSYDGTLRSIEDSLQRLGLERIDVALIHDCDLATHGARHFRGRFEEAMADFTAARGVYERIGSPSVALALTREGSMHALRGDAFPARAAFEAAVRAARDAADSQALAPALIGREISGHRRLSRQG